MESDWKKFRALLPVWRERYLVKCNGEITRILCAPGKTDTERFWDAEERIADEAKVLSRCLDDLRRSKMLERLYAMRAAHMIEREDLADFSEELQKQIFDPGI